jgi:dTDP-4-dehydrorhamnose reductase
MAEKPILVAGKSGQLARCLHDSAVLRNVPMVAVGRPELNLENGEGIVRAMAAVEPSAIVNAAAYTAVDPAEAEPRRGFGVNCGGAALLADATARRGIPFIQISTDYVFDGSKRSPYREDDVPAPLNVYGSSKLAGETAVLKACPGAAVIRTSWVDSPYGNNFVRIMLRLSETQLVVRIVDDQRGAPTSAADLAGAILSIVERLRSANGYDDAGVYHLAADGETSWHGFAAAIFASVARRARRVPTLQAVTTAEYPTPARRPKYSCLDSSKAERIFGVRLAPWRSSLEECLDQLEMPKELHAC